ncbi:hypothetical protein RVU96_16875 [Bordetella avium]|uniref:hypothetical protein n=1 Tax=Bordetella avium TaxID=521 RepID=UPI000E0CB607|nr:hypothetical protein [Bordetella avium]RIQ11588.1 hypothetical protein D0432_16395 [Bordetella avium]RIQ44913.1 hypothetical protein D0845_17045 [Bordetella avium]RIQ49563.1 hypothetical protein D0844_16340 [Bordetella avium]RIQ55340.1 hypothetical protein D0841_16610 [Bordetella avium]RIQ58408.1 hypothetical protein D0842_16435 [Bordetella avium]
MSKISMPEPVAWMTHHDEPMIFLSAIECAHYCDEGEIPIPLIVGIQAEAYASAKVREALEDLLNTLETREFDGGQRQITTHIRSLTPSTPA